MRRPKKDPTWTQNEATLLSVVILLPVMALLSMTTLTTPAALTITLPWWAPYVAALLPAFPYLLQR